MSEILLNDEIKLCWKGPFSFKDLLTNERYKKDYKCSGVYLWEMASAEAPQYIGKATGRPGLWLRQFHHYISLIGGHYTVPPQFTNNGKEWICDYEKNEVLEILFNEQKFKEVISYGFRYAAAIKIFLAKLSQEKVNIVERNLLHDLKPSTTFWGTQTVPKELVKIVHCETSCPTTIAGA
ncbi:MAG: hypothetical protein WC647_17345 [Desulfomonilaceae bacterium]|jgi:hypothetical protein